MEGPESTTTETTTGKLGMDQTVLMSSKPLHRFVQREPRSLGIVIVIFGCAELLIGIHLAGSDDMVTSNEIYIPFWQGLLFLICGSLSIYTELHPSKKMVTVCLAMYVVSLFGVIVSVGYRIHCFGHYTFLSYHHWDEDVYYMNRMHQILCIEAILCTSSLCASVLLIFLCTVARLALKSTRTQAIVQLILQPQSDTSN